MRIAWELPYRRADSLHRRPSAETTFRHVESAAALTGIDSLESVHPKQHHVVNREDPATLPAATCRPRFVAHSTWRDGSSPNRTSRWLMGSDKVTTHEI